CSVTWATSAPDLARPALHPRFTPAADGVGVEEHRLFRDTLFQVFGDTRLCIEDADVVVARPPELGLRLQVEVDELLGQILHFRPAYDLRHRRRREASFCGKDHPHRAALIDLRLEHDAADRY